MKIVILFVLVALTAASPATFLSKNIIIDPVSDSGLEGRVTNGQTATKGQFPYVASLLIASLTVPNAYFICGGTLIGHEWVVTAAHCVDEGDVTVRLGGINSSNFDVTHVVPVANVITHPDWNSALIHNDIALIKIPYTAYSTNIQPLQLPAYSAPLSNYAGQSAKILGWGGMANGNTAYDLQYASTTILAQDTCAQSLDLIDSILCITTVPSSTCGGDSGGPLESGGRLVGVTSFVVGGCSGGYPSGFTRITSHLWFIKKNTGISY